MMTRIVTASWRLNVIKNRTQCPPVLQPGTGVVLKSAGKAVTPQWRIRKTGAAGAARPPAQPALSALETGSLHHRDRKTCLATAAPREALKAKSDRHKRERGACQCQGKKKSSSQPVQQRGTSCLRARWDMLSFRHIQCKGSASFAEKCPYHPHDLDSHTYRTNVRNNHSGPISEKAFSFLSNWINWNYLSFVRQQDLFYLYGYHKTPILEWSKVNNSHCSAFVSLLWTVYISLKYCMIQKGKIILYLII